MEETSALVFLDAPPKLSRGFPVSLMAADPEPPKFSGQYEEDSGEYRPFNAMETPETESGYGITLYVCI